jgi:hypothetical protein
VRETAVEPAPEPGDDGVWPETERRCSCSRRILENQHRPSADSTGSTYFCTARMTVLHPTISSVLIETPVARLTRPLATTQSPPPALLASAPQHACPHRKDSRPSRSSVRPHHPSSKDVPEGVRAFLESRPTLISSICARFCGSLSSILFSRSLRRGSHSSGNAGLCRH